MKSNNRNFPSKATN